MGYNAADTEVVYTLGSHSIIFSFLRVVHTFQLVFY